MQIFYVPLQKLKKDRQARKNTTFWTFWTDKMILPLVLIIGSMISDIGAGFDGFCSITHD